MSCKAAACKDVIDICENQDEDCVLGSAIHLRLLPKCRKFPQEWLILLRCIELIIRLPFQSPDAFLSDTANTDPPPRWSTSEPLVFHGLIMKTTFSAVEGELLEETVREAMRGSELLDAALRVVANIRSYHVDCVSS